MRTFKLSLCTTIILCLMVSASATIAAEDRIPGGAAQRLSGQLTAPLHVYGPDPAPGSPGIMTSKWQYDVAWNGEVQLPDRVTLVMHEDLHFMAGDERHAVVCWGHVTFEDAEGYLVGPVHGFAIDGDAQLQAMLTGGGAYEGVNAIVTGPIGGAGGGAIEGLVFEGYMPQERFLPSTG